MTKKMAASFIGGLIVSAVALYFAFKNVPLAELFNSAIEAIVDRFGGETHELSGRAKDIGSAAVFLAIAMAAVVWLLVLMD